MKTTLFLLALCLGIACALHTEAEYRAAFTSWMDEHGKAYTSDEFFYRYDIFKTNMDYVTAWNAAGSPTVLGMTNMADLTNSEYQGVFLGTRINAKERLRLASLSHFVPDKTTTVADTVDWRTKGAVTAIKDQGQCGSCWAFSAIATTEAAHFFSTGDLVSLSEQNLVDCSGSFGNQGCNGGLMDSAFKYIISNKGIDTEDSYPYKAVTGTCQFQAANVGATLNSFLDIKAGNEAALLEAINKSPISVAIDASKMSFQLYKSGVYYEAKCSSQNLDHGVTAVGYGSDATGGDYYIVKNSWGESWGQEGYIWMSRNKNNNCGIATASSYPTA